MHELQSQWCNALPSFCDPSLYHISPTFGPHPPTKAMLILALDRTGLVRPFDQKYRSEQLRRSIAHKRLYCAEYIRLTEYTTCCEWRAQKGSVPGLAEAGRLWNCSECRHSCIIVAQHNKMAGRVARAVAGQQDRPSSKASRQLSQHLAGPPVNGVVVVKATCKGSEALALAAATIMMTFGLRVPICTNR